MPRVNPARSTTIEERLADRIAAERSARNWSYEHLAAMMHRMGCPIHGSAIFKIERGQPRRRITVDEMVGFAAAFGMQPSELLDESDPAGRAWAEVRVAIENLLDARVVSGKVSR